MIGDGVQMCLVLSSVLSNYPSYCFVWKYGKRRNVQKRKKKKINDESPETPILNMHTENQQIRCAKAFHVVQNHFIIYYNPTHILCIYTLSHPVTLTGNQNWSASYLQITQPSMSKQATPQGQAWVFCLSSSVFEALQSVHHHHHHHHNHRWLLSGWSIMGDHDRREGAQPDDSDSNHSDEEDDDDYSTVMVSLLPVCFPYSIPLFSLSFSSFLSFLQPSLLLSLSLSLSC